MENPTLVNFFGYLKSGCEVSFEVEVDFSVEDQDKLVEQLERNMITPDIQGATVLNIGDHLIRAELYDYITITFEEVEDEFEDGPTHQLEGGPRV